MKRYGGRILNLLKEEDGVTAVEPESQIEISEGDGRMFLMEPGARLSDIVDAVNEVFKQGLKQNDEFVFFGEDIDLTGYHHIVLCAKTIFEDLFPELTLNHINHCLSIF